MKFENEIVGVGVLSCSLTRKFDTQKTNIIFAIHKIKFVAYNASFGQLFTHSKQKIHSVPFLRFLELSVISTSIGHTLLHFPHDMHLLVSHFILNKEK